MEIINTMDWRFIFLFSIIYLIDIYDESFKKSLTNYLSFDNSEILKQSIKIFLFIHTYFFNLYNLKLYIN